MLAPAEDQSHLIEALDAVARRLGALVHRWRFDRMATSVTRIPGRLTATFGLVAAHYAVGIDICPARHGNRKGVVERPPDRRAALVARVARRADPGPSPSPNHPRS